MCNGQTIVPGLNAGPKPFAKSLTSNLETHTASEQSVSLRNGSDGKDVVRSEGLPVTGRIGAMRQSERMQTYHRSELDGGIRMQPNRDASTMGIENTRTKNTRDSQNIDFESLDWDAIERHVRGLQISISKAYSQGKYNLAKRKSYLLTHSFDAKLLAVRKVTSNQGRYTAGVDGVTWVTSEDKFKGAESLESKGYKTKPLRRIYIPKSNGKLRPLSIPTMKDRAMQTLYGFALDAIQETTADPNSYGFRIGRGCKDANEELFTILSKKNSAQWILDCDIRSCFDKISHEWLIDNVPMDKKMLRKFLKAGYVYEKKLFPTDEGTPQGGTISPVLANMTLNRLEPELKRKFGPRSKVNLVRFADDMVVTASSYDVAVEAKALITEFLAERGLEFSEEKTKIVHISEGFDFLSYNFRKFKDKYRCSPSKKAMKRFKDELSRTVKSAVAWTQDDLIKTLNQKIRGWCRYQDITTHSKEFKDIDNHVFRILVEWARFRHPRKNWTFIKQKYWHRRGNNNWIFCTEDSVLVRAESIPRKKHVKIRSSTNAYLDWKYIEQHKAHFKAVPVKRD